ncbi:MAG TPA: class I SAM-dependent methyltransferase [Bryobacteraceae bacterium]|nr:class I SAM-dependent methyltransferase [Bryobacteraceae bacterium]
MFESVPVSEVQNYWNARPCNIRHSTKEPGSQEYFNEVEARKYRVEPHIPAFAEFEKWRGKKVLEIGCGIGTDTTNFARAGAQVTAVDLSDKSIEMAKKRLEVFGLSDRVRFVQANSEQLSDSLPPEPFDLIYSFGVIHHTPHPERVLEQLKLYTKPDTTVKLMVYNRWSWKVLWILVRYGKGQIWKLDELVADNSEAQNGCPVTYVYSRRQGRELLRAGGLQTIEARAEHIFPYRIPDYVKYRYVKVWYFRWMPGPLFRALERMAGWHLLLTGVPERGA